MASRFSFSRPGRGADDPWFRIGSVDVTTTVFVVIVTAVSMVVTAVAPILLDGLLFTPARLFNGEVWRVLTWPLATPISFWSIVTLFFFWYFGSELEAQIGRRPMATFLLMVIGALTVIATLLGLLGLNGFLAGLDVVQTLVFLLFIAQHPERRFFFGIPAWVIGAIIVALQILSPLSVRYWFGLFLFLGGMLVTVVIARQVGLLAESTWMPNLPRPPRRRRRLRSVTNDTGFQASRQAHPAAYSTSPQARDQAALDALLDKISDGGIESLSKSERKQLLELRERLRRR